MIPKDPTIYLIDHHKIALETVDADALFVIEKLKKAGHSAYLVGGGVRDLLLNIRPKDFDISTSAKPEQVKRIFKNALLIGRRFRLAHIRFGKKIIEVSTFRSGESSSHLIVQDNQWGSEEEDVLRRDFTINGLFYDPERQCVIDYVQGYQDLEKRTLRAIGTPSVRFQQDPVRMIRLIKFCARFDFEIAPSTFEALLECRKEITKSSQARVFEELLRMLESGSAKPFFHLLHQYGLLSFLLPEVSYFFDHVAESPILQLLHEIDAEIKKDSSISLDRSILLAALVFPLLDAYLQEMVKTQNKMPHLGQVETIAFHVIDCIFNPFFILPRKMKATIASILLTQYRFTPLDPQISRRPRLPKDMITKLALQFFKLRTQVNSALLPQYTFWHEYILQSALMPTFSKNMTLKTNQHSSP